MVAGDQYREFGIQVVVPKGAANVPVMNGLDAARTLNRRTSQVNSVKRAQYAFVFTGLMRKTYDTAHPHAHRNLFSNWF